MIESALTYHRATVNDIAAIASLLPAAYQDHQSAIGEEQWNRMKRNLANQDQLAKLMEVAIGFSCQFQQQVVGIIFLIPSGNPMQIFPADWSYIRLLGVDPNYRYRSLGIGKKLTQLCLEQAQQMGEKAIGLHTSEFMSPARTMYERLGFRQVKELEPIYNKRYWLYKLTLKPN